MVSTYQTKARFHVECRTWIRFRYTKILKAPYGKIKHELVILSYNCDVKLGLKLFVYLFVCLYALNLCGC